MYTPAHGPPVRVDVDLVYPLTESLFLPLNDFSRALEENQARRKAEEIALKRLQEQLENQQTKEEAANSLKTSQQPQSPTKQASLLQEMEDRFYRDRKVAVRSDSSFVQRVRRVGVGLR